MKKRKVKSGPPGAKAAVQNPAVATTASGEALEVLLLQAVTAHQAGSLREAERVYERILSLNPRYTPAMHLLGMISGETGRVARGIELLRKVVAIDSQSFEARAQLAILLRSDGRAAEAVQHFQQALRLKPGDAGTHNNLGVTHLSERQYAEAVACFERAIELKPDFAICHQNLGDALRLLNRDREAAESYRTAIQLSPNLAEVHVRLGQLALMDGDAEEADACFRRAAAVQPETAQGLMQFARVLAEAWRLEDAEAALRRAAELDQSAGSARQLLGETLQQLGRFDEAIAVFERGIALDPARTSYYSGISSSKKFRETDRPFIERATTLLDRPDLTEPDRIALHYTLGKAADDLADYPSAIRHFDDANRMAAERLRLSGRSLDRKRHSQNVDSLMAAFTREFFARHALTGSRTELPVLVLGMIRSGTTLAQQILSSHPEIGTGGELRYWGDRGSLVGDAATGKLDSAALGNLAENYCRILRGAAPGATRVVDKMPTNFLLLGLIHLALPQARIIHCRRNPVDTCLSIYFTPYSRSPDYAHDRTNIVFYYEQYNRLMAHWRNVLPPDRFLEVDYEDMVADRERVTRQMIEFCGVGWDDACLRPESNSRAIRTPSLWQARQPVYNSSVERWRRYEPWLGEFRHLPGQPAS